ncbi:MAG TPA: hypothetical protein VF273_03385 [Pelobium sp.]
MHTDKSHRNFSIKNIAFALGFILCFVYACKKDEVEAANATVIKDCTGNYLRVNEQDFLICNAEVVALFGNGATVVASFEKVNTCNGSGANSVVCAMYHQNQGWIKVQMLNGKAVVRRLASRSTFK